MNIKNKIIKNLFKYITNNRKYMLQEDKTITNESDVNNVLNEITDNNKENNTTTEKLNELEKQIEKTVNKKISTATVGETYAFSADISQLMSLIINSFYSNKDIFLRELISNASDALDKIRYQSLTNASVLDSESELKIQILADKENNTLTIRDSGIGMTKDDLINNLGTIAKSGTKAFMEALDAGADMSMIGQFGVGFYSAYLVAENVSVISKNNNDETYKWSSKAGGSFSIIRDSDNELKRGTEIVLKLKEDMKEYLEESKLKSLVKTHSEFIDFPIELYVERTEEKEVTDDEEDEETNDAEETEKNLDGEKDNNEVKVEEVNEDEESKKEKKTKMITEVRHEWEKLNKQKPLWCKNSKDISQEEYDAFYKNLTNDWDSPMGTKHFSVEGNLEFKGILFVPKRAPFQMLAENADEKRNIKLYVRKVFITDESHELLPHYLSFVRGVVDSEDLPLNISREMLQQNKIMRIIKKNLVKRCIELFTEISEDKEKYAEFYKQFSKGIKLGVHEDEANRNKLVKLLRYETANSNGELLSLDDYIKNMKEEQPGIYYITGESIDMIKSSPFLEGIVSRGFDVLLMSENIDEYSVQQMKEYEGKKLINITKDNVELGEDSDEKEKFEETKKELEPLCKTIKSILGDEIKEVIVSNRLKNSPSCLVTSGYGYSANMQRIARAQALSSTNPMMGMVSNNKAMEINYKHPIINAMKERVAENNNDNTVRDLTWLLYDTSLLTSGFSLKKPTDFANRINNLIKLGLSIDVEEDDDLNDLPDIDDTEETKTATEEGEDNEGEDMEEVD
jgi:molecular chaperone HtpG